MLRLIAALALTALLTAACSSPGTDNPDDPGAEPTQGRCDPALDEGLRVWSDAGFSGTVAISTGGGFDCLGAYGRADRADGTANTPDTVFGIGSVSKAFTAVAVLDLVDHDALSLGDRAGAILPRLHGPAAYATIRQLLLHTSGLTGSLGDDHVALGHDAAVRKASELRRAHPPGTHFLYSNAGYTLLALIVQHASGEPYPQYLQSRILRLPDGSGVGGFWDGEPAAPGPRAAGYLEDGPSDQRGAFAGPHWALSGNGDLAMTMRDLARWTYALHDGDLLSPRSTRLLAETRFSHGGGRSELAGWVAFDRSVYGVPVRAAAGGGDLGHNVVVAWVPGRQRVIAIASNTPTVRAEDLLPAIAPAVIAGHPVPPPEPAAEAVDPQELAAVAGRYPIGTDAALHVAARAGGLTITARGREAVEALFPLPADVPPDAAEAHEAGVEALLRGETAEGREERALFESDYGDITDVVAAGTLVVDGEVRTYVTVRTATESMLGWYAIDDAGGVSAAEIPTDPPSLAMVPGDGDHYIPDSPAGTGPDVTVGFDGDSVKLTGPDGTVRTRPAD